MPTGRRHRWPATDGPRFDAHPCDHPRRTYAPRGSGVGRGRRARCRLRGHRHQPDLHRPDRVQPERPPPGRGQHGQRLRDHLVDLLVRDDHRHVDLRHADHARRQRRRGRHHGADHAHQSSGRSRKSASGDSAGRAGDLRRVAVLRRQHDHAGDLGTVRGRGTQGRRAIAGEPGRADHGGDHHRAVRVPTGGHRSSRTPVRSGDDHLVPGHRRVRVSGASSTTRRS